MNSIATDAEVSTYDKLSALGFDDDEIAVVFGVDEKFLGSCLADGRRRQQDEYDDSRREEGATE